MLKHLSEDREREEFIFTEREIKEEAAVCFDKNDHEKHEGRIACIQNIKHHRIHLRNLLYKTHMAPFTPPKHSFCFSHFRVSPQGKQDEGKTFYLTEESLL